MRLVSFTVVKFRSIKTAHKIRVGSKTILVGPNNEGKSNLIRALVTAMRVLTMVRVQPALVRSQHIRQSLYRQFYEWERDYPIELQGTEPNGQSEITLEFELSPQEIEDFRREIHSNLNGTLPLVIALGPKGGVAIKVSKKGPGGRVLTGKSAQIAEFVSQRANFEHIPAVRTAAAAQRIVAEMIQRELETLESDEGYKTALQAIERLQEPVLDRLSESIQKTLSQFLPDVTTVKVRIPPEDRYRALRGSCQITVDDGTATLLEHKGDGVQSLAALGIMRHSSETSAIGRNLVVAIEEPESHLHPGAIHELREVLDELATHHQVVVTTHNPLFVDRTQLRSNIVVKDRKARPARTITELREVLGVRASDNLQHAEVVLLVEGTDDRTALSSLLRSISPRIKQALDSGALALEALEGATNLSYKSSLIRQALCSVHAFLDDDEAGHQGFDRARLHGVVTDRDVSWSTCDGMAESEVEDLYEPALYSAMLQNTYRVSTAVPEFRSARKWSARAATAFRRQGKQWNDRIEGEVKTRIAELVAAEPDRALLPARRGALDGLALSLEAQLTEVSRQR